MNLITIRDLIRTLFRRKHAIFITLFLVMSVVFVSFSLSTPRYYAKTKLLISSQKQVNPTFYRDVTDFNKTEISVTQSEMILSNPVLIRTIKALRLHNTGSEYEKQYCSSLKAFMLDCSDALNQQILKPLNSFLSGEEDSNPTTFTLQTSIESLKKNIAVEPVTGSHVIAIIAKDFNPVRAAQIANTIAKSAVIFDIEQQIVELSQEYGERHPLMLQMRDNCAKLQELLTIDSVSTEQAIGPASIKIIEQAQPPLKPGGALQRPIIFVISLLLGLTLGIGCAFALEYTDRSFHSTQSIETTFGIPVLGSIPVLQRKNRVNDLTYHPNNDQFIRSLADNLYLIFRQRSIKTIAMTASLSGEGTTLMTAMLAGYCSKVLKVRTLLIDANFRSPQLSHMAKLSQSPGIAEYISGTIDLASLYREIEPNLFILPCRESIYNPVILLNSERFSSLLQQVYSQWDMIIVDTPSCREYSDTSIITKICDASILLVTYGQTRQETVKCSLETISHDQNSALGIIFNKRHYEIPRFLYNWI